MRGREGAKVRVYRGWGPAQDWASSRCSRADAPVAAAVASEEIRRGGHGRRKSDLGPPAGGAADRDGAAVGLDDALDDVEPEAGATALAAPPEAGEDAVHGLLRDAGTLVAHRDRRAGVLPLAG